MKPARKFQPRKTGSRPASRKRQYVYLDEEELRSLRITAAELGISISHAIQQAIRAFCIDHHHRKVER
ncbi:MAG: hypothetical protein OXF11_01135 [Deltaproteobacteria bacterium]|nr:hypothetical protein [Deltaproteobacteria bacterium]